MREVKVDSSAFIRNDMGNIFCPLGNNPEGNVLCHTQCAWFHIEMQKEYDTDTAPVVPCAMCKGHIIGKIVEGD